MKMKSTVKEYDFFEVSSAIILCWAPKYRDADHLQNLIYDQDNVFKVESEEILQAVREEKLPIPEHACDVHTKKGRYMGKTKKNFFLEEYQALIPLSSSPASQQVPGTRSIEEYRWKRTITSSRFPVHENRDLLHPCLIRSGQGTTLFSFQQEFFEFLHLLPQAGQFQLLILDGCF